jgi:hypothetical protein
MVSSNGTVVILDANTRQPRWTIKYFQPELPFEILLHETLTDDHDDDGVRISNTFTYTGAMDAVVEDGNGHLFVLELKTSGHANNSLWRDKWKMDTQPRGYVWAISQHTQKPIAGAIIIPIAVGRKDCKMTPEIHLMFTPDEMNDWKELALRSFHQIATDVDHLPTGRYNGNCINSYLGRCDFFDYCRSGYKEEILMQITEVSQWSPMNRLNERLAAQGNSK